MHDLIIRNAAIVDGTGAPCREGDVVVDDGTIVEVAAKGSAPASAARVIDAGGDLLLSLIHISEPTDS